MQNSSANLNLILNRKLSEFISIIVVHTQMPFADDVIGVSVKIDMKVKTFGAAKLYALMCTAK